ncbi:MAG: UDP-N-acetylmuramoyl-L-alanine--D-glutamate ligase, partial [Oceanospirillum sp.]|nr:UDP-N-acetylmuramoyl-L-alanine--D-glutamate ligase [Oceanospirillum sp.]
GPIILIAGGDGKGAEFDELADPVDEHCKSVVLIGRDASLIAEALKPGTPVYQVQTMEEAVAKAVSLSASGDQVLLSPACASWDMFKNYIVRGQAFTSAVKDICCAG